LSPKIAFYDLENAPSLGWYYDRYREGNIVADEQDWFLLSFAWKWAGESKVHVKALCDYPSYAKHKTDDSHLVKDLWKLFDEADILIGHNGDRFDKRKSNSRFLGCGLPPPSPYKTIDTLKIARRQFLQNSNKLGELGDFLGLGSKMPTTGWHTWRGCIDGDPKAWASLKRYNKRDVALLEQVYEKLKPWNPNPPDFRAMTGKHSCRVCGSLDIQFRGVERTLTTTKHRYKCNACQHWGSAPNASAPPVSAGPDSSPPKPKQHRRGRLAANS
jgi:hypothetical protein